MELVDLAEKQEVYSKNFEEKNKHICSKCQIKQEKIYLPCFVFFFKVLQKLYIYLKKQHGLCETCFEVWKEQQSKNIKCLICGLDIAYNKTFLDGKVFVLENDFEQLNSNFKDQIKDFFQEKKIKVMF